MRLLYQVLAVLLVAVSASAGTIDFKPVPVDSSTEGYSDESKEMFKKCLAALQSFVTRIQKDAVSDSKIAAALKLMQTQEIKRTSTYYYDQLQPGWSFQWPKIEPVYTNGTYTNILPPIEVILLYNERGVRQGLCQTIQDTKYRCLNVPPTNQLLVVYRIEIDDTQTVDKVRKALGSALSFFRDTELK